MDYLIHFATNLDPNGGSSPRWPQYTNASPQLMTLLPSNGTDITQDTFRADGLDYITQLHLAHSVYDKGRLFTPTSEQGQHFLGDL
jgi:acetylcholinesterase